MTIEFQPATRKDLAAIVSLLSDDPMGAKRENASLSTYEAAFERMQKSGAVQLIVGRVGAEIVATYQLAILPGLSHSGATRAQVEGVRIQAGMRSRGFGARLMADAEQRARAEGARIIQLTTHRSRRRAHAFYDRLGFTASHIGYKRDLR